MPHPSLAPFYKRPAPSRQKQLAGQQFGEYYSGPGGVWEALKELISPTTAPSPLQQLSPAQVEGLAPPRPPVPAGARRVPDAGTTVRDQRGGRPISSLAGLGADYPVGQREFGRFAGRVRDLPAPGTYDYAGAEAGARLGQMSPGERLMDLIMSRTGLGGVGEEALGGAFLERPDVPEGGFDTLSQVGPLDLPEPEPPQPTAGQRFWHGLRSALDIIRPEYTMPETGVTFSWGPGRAQQAMQMAQGRAQAGTLRDLAQADLYGAQAGEARAGAARELEGPSPLELFSKLAPILGNIFSSEEATRRAMGLSGLNFEREQTLELLRQAGLLEREQVRGEYGLAGRRISAGARIQAAQIAAESGLPPEAMETLGWALDVLSPLGRERGATREDGIAAIGIIRDLVPELVPRYLPVLREIEERD